MKTRSRAPSAPRHAPRHAPRRNPDKADAPSVPPRIVEILSVRDTRTYVEVSPGVWIVDNDSGEWRVCPRCGQQHVIHATVRLDNGRTEILGRECARRDSTSMAKKVDAAFAAQTKEDELRRSIQSLRRQLREWEQAKALVAKMVPPPVEVLGYLRSEVPLRVSDVPTLPWGPEPRSFGYADREWFVGMRCGDVYSIEYALTEDPGQRQKTARRAWRRARLLEATGLDAEAETTITENLHHAEKKLSRLLAKREKE